MDKTGIRNILMSMRTHENDAIVNNLLAKIDSIPDDKLQTMISQVGNTDESIKSYLQDKLAEKQARAQTQEEHTPINSLFTYGVSNNSIHLHMPIMLDQIKSKGKNTQDIVNLYLLDAIERIRTMQNDGFYKFKGKDSIYMISPILVSRELKFLNELDFTTQSYRKRELQNPEFVEQNPEAQLATEIFGTSHNVGTARISMGVVNSSQWQEKRKSKIKEFEEKGITLDDKTTDAK